MIFTNKNGNQINVIESDYNKNKNKDFKGIIISVHGIGSHFQDIGYQFKYNLEGRSLVFYQLGLLSYCLELEGHGLSQGERCCIYDFNDLVIDLKQLILILKEKNQNLPIYLMGFSMGGAIIVHLCIKYPNLVNGVILMAPMCGITNAMRPSLPVEYILKFLLLFFPTKQWVPGSDKDFLKKCSKNVDFINIKKEDNISYKHNHRLTTAFQCLNACDYIKHNNQLFNTPLLIFHGDTDLVTDYKISQEFFNKINSADKQFITVNNGYHSLLIPSDENDTNPEMIINQIKLWLSAKITEYVVTENNSNRIIDNNLIIKKNTDIYKYITIFSTLFLLFALFFSNYLLIFLR